ncbi:MAG: signal transduction histidine kinase [Planctomycetota bacterium]
MSDREGAAETDENQRVVLRAGFESSQLDSAIVHDLNNLLTAVSGCTEQLEFALPREDPAQKDLGEIYEAVGDASLLVRLIHRSAPDAAPVFEDLSLGPLMRVALNLIRKLLPRSIEIQLERGSLKSTARGDVVVVLRILIELARLIGERIDAKASIVFSLSELDEESCIKVVGTPSRRGIETELPEHLMDLAQSIEAIIQGAGSQWTIALPATSSLRPSGTCEDLGLKQVVIAEPDGLLSSFFVSTLKAQDRILAEDASQLTRALEEHGENLDLALIGIDLKGYDPIGAYASIRQKFPKLALAFFSKPSAMAKQMSRLIEKDQNAILLIKPFGVAQLTSSISKMMTIE